MSYFNILWHVLILYLFLELKHTISKQHFKRSSKLHSDTLKNIACILCIDHHLILAISTVMTPKYIDTVSGKHKLYTVIKSDAVMTYNPPNMYSRWNCIFGTELSGHSLAIFSPVILRGDKFRQTFIPAQCLLTTVCTMLYIIHPFSVSLISQPIGRKKITFAMDTSNNNKTNLCSPFLNYSACFAYFRVYFRWHLS